MAGQILTPGGVDVSTCKVFGERNGKTVTYRRQQLHLLAPTTRSRWRGRQQPPTTKRDRPCTSTVSYSLPIAPVGCPRQTRNKPYSSYSPGCLSWMALFAMPINDSHTSRVSWRLLASIVLRNMVLLKNLICAWYAVCKERRVFQKRHMCWRAT